MCCAFFGSYKTARKHHTCKIRREGPSLYSAGIVLTPRGCTPPTHTQTSLYRWSRRLAWKSSSRRSKREARFRALPDGACLVFVLVAHIYLILSYASSSMLLQVQQLQEKLRHLAQVHECPVSEGLPAAPAGNPQRLRVLQLHVLHCKQDQGLPALRDEGVGIGSNQTRCC